jgi:hypothetical protein
MSPRASRGPQHKGKKASKAAKEEFDPQPHPGGESDRLDTLGSPTEVGNPSASSSVESGRRVTIGGMSGSAEGAAAADPANPAPDVAGVPPSDASAAGGTGGGVAPFPGNFPPQDRRGSFNMDDFFAGRRASIGFDSGASFTMDNFFGGPAGRRDSLDSTTAALDAAIMDLSRRRLSVIGSSMPPGGVGPLDSGAMMDASQRSDPFYRPYSSGRGGYGRESFSNPMGYGSALDDRGGYGYEAPSRGSMGGSGLPVVNSIHAKQQQLQQQQRELEQRQKELEIQRQQLISSMHGPGAYPPIGRASESTGGGRGTARSSTGATASGGQQWWICQVCNSKAFSSHEEAMQHEQRCQGGLGGSMRAQPPYLYPYPNSALGPQDPLGISQSMQTSLRGPSTVSINPMETVSRNFSMGFDSLHSAHSLHSATSASTYDTPHMSNGPYALMDNPMPLAMPSDKDWLTPLHCFVRRHCVEVFTATDMDVATPSKGKRKPIHVGQVGIRCPHCHQEQPPAAEQPHRDSLGQSSSSSKTRERGSVYYPTTISSIYNATMNLLQRHLHNCTAVPEDIMQRYEALKADDARSGTSKRYWIESALSLGLVDTLTGIRFSALRPPPLPSLTREQNTTGLNAQRRNSNEFFSSTSNAVELNDDSADAAQSAGSDKPAATGKKSKSSKNSPSKGGSAKSAGDVTTDLHTEDMPEYTGEDHLANSAPLVSPEDKSYSTAFSFHLLSQMQPCVFTEADRLGKRKGLPPGFPGLACRHCFGGYGSGRFFPSSIKTLSDTSKTLNVLYNHMMRCRKCPQDVRKMLQDLRSSHDDERAKMKFGSQKAFFARIWECLHGKGAPAVGGMKNRIMTNNGPGPMGMPHSGQYMGGGPMMPPQYPPQTMGHMSSRGSMGMASLSMAAHGTTGPEAKRQKMM